MKCSASRTTLSEIVPIIALFLLFPQVALCREMVRKEQDSPSHASPKVFVLDNTETIGFSQPAPTAVESSIKCGPNGEIYAVYNDNQAEDIWKQPISKISISSKTVTQYRTPAMPGYYNPARIDFNVQADGTLYSLVQVSSSRQSDEKRRLAYFLIKYRDDGSVDSQIRVGDESGKRVEPMRVAVFADGDFLLSGTYGLRQEEIAEGAKLDTFAGIWGREGTFLSPMKLMEPTAAAESSLTSSVNPYSEKLAKEDANAVSLGNHTLYFGSPDENIYALQGAHNPHLYVISTTGDILRETILKPPSASLTPVQMSGAGSGYLFIYYSHIVVGVPEEDISQPGLITVLNQQTEEVVAVYKMPSNTEGFSVPACADSSDDFLFLGADKNNHLAILRYAAR